MKRTLSLLLAAALLLSCVGLLSGCSSQETVTLRVYCEGDLIRSSLMDEFSKETGILVEYTTGNSTLENGMNLTEDEEDPAGGASSSGVTPELTEEELAALEAEEAWEALSLYDRLQQRYSDYEEALAQAEADGGETESVTLEEPVYDVVFTSGDVIEQLIEAGLVQALDYSQLSNADAINEEYQNCDYDPGGIYSVTTLWQMMGLLWNSDYIDTQVTSWNTLWTEAYAGQILMPSDLRDAMAVALTSLGYSVNTESSEELAAAWDLLGQQSALVQDYTAAEGFSRMTDGTAWLTPAYSGDALNMMSDNTALSFAVPTEGTWRISYGYCVVEGTSYSEEALAFINYMCQEENLAKNAIYCKYSVTSDGALEKMDSSWRNNPLAYPDESVIAGTELLSFNGSDTWTDYVAQWAELLEAKAAEAADSPEEETTEESDASEEQGDTEDDPAEDASSDTENEASAS
ncbi:MAG: spermidine/putrescine ABC transporter substrate-binding protein [Clostridiales bacterium]|nr:spermidine/putrescine ABC transporter substrate-binding protein [Clostridiales bacterium]